MKVSLFAKIQNIKAMEFFISANVISGKYYLKSLNLNMTYSTKEGLTYSEDYKFIKDCGFEPLADFKQTYIKTDNLSNRNELDLGANILSYRMPF